MKKHTLILAAFILAASFFSAQGFGFGDILKWKLFSGDSIPSGNIPVSVRPGLLGDSGISAAGIQSNLTRRTSRWVEMNGTLDGGNYVMSLLPNAPAMYKPKISSSSGTFYQSIEYMTTNILLKFKFGPVAETNTGVNFKIDLYGFTNGTQALSYNCDQMAINATNDYWLLNIAVPTNFYGIHAQSIRIYTTTNSVFTGSPATGGWPTNGIYIVVLGYQIKEGY